MTQSVEMEPNGLFGYISALSELQTCKCPFGEHSSPPRKNEGPWTPVRELNATGATSSVRVTNYKQGLYEHMRFVFVSDVLYFVDCNEYQTVELYHFAQ